MFKLWGKEYDFSFENLFPKPDKKGPIPAKLRKYRKDRRNKRLVANASRRKNRGRD